MWRPAAGDIPCARERDSLPAAGGPAQGLCAQDGRGLHTGHAGLHPHGEGLGGHCQVRGLDMLIHIFLSFMNVFTSWLKSDFDKVNMQKE